MKLWMELKKKHLDIVDKSEIIFLIQIYLFLKLTMQVQYT